MPPIGLLIKPASSNCNLRCKYCFYHSVAESRQTSSYGIMDIETLEYMVKKTLEFADIVCTFAFQGGEPTVAGLEFFKKLIEFEKKYNIKNVKIENAIQTNGFVINDEWAKFLHDNNFLVGLSLDGPKDIHDANRIDAKGKGTFARIMKTVELFNEYKVEYNILTVVNGYVAGYADKMFNFFNKNNFKYLQFIPCLDPLGEIPGNYKHSLTPQKYEKFLKDLFDLYYKNIKAGNMVSIRTFDNYIRIILGYGAEQCGMLGSCQIQYVIEADGGVYPCDFYVIDEWYLGNIKDKSFEELRDSDNGKRFIEVSRHIDDACKECKWFKLCFGGCRRYREPFIDGKPALNYFCEAHKNFFDYSIDRMLEIAKLFSKR